MGARKNVQFVRNHVGDNSKINIMGIMITPIRQTTDSKEGFAPRKLQRDSDPIDGDLEEDDWGYVEAVLRQDLIDLEALSMEGSEAKEEFEEIKVKYEDGKGFCHQLNIHLSKINTSRKHTNPLNI